MPEPPSYEQIDTERADWKRWCMEHEAEVERLREELALRDDSLANRRVRELKAEVERLREALRYIAGFDVAGYDAHLRAEDVAKAALDG